MCRKATGKVDSWAGSRNSLENRNLLKFLEVLSCSRALRTVSDRPPRRGFERDACCVTDCRVCVWTAGSAGRINSSSACDVSVPVLNDGGFSAVRDC